MTYQSHPTPPAPPSDKLDTLLTEHFAATLDPQRGRAAAAFRQHLQSGSKQSDNGPIPISRGVVSKRALWYWAGVPSLVAACLAVAVTLQVVKPVKIEQKPVEIAKNPDVTPISPSAGDSGRLVFDTPSLDQLQTIRDIDGGVTLLADNTPVRIIRRQSVQQLQFVDPNDHNATISITQPVEKVGYVKVQPY